MSLSTRFWNKVLINEDNPDGCWMWLGAKLSSGHGQFAVNRKLKGPHVLTFNEFGGSISKDKPMVLHNCNNASCVNPHHLRAGDASDNAKDAVKAGVRFGISQSQKTHCKHGHALTEDNLTKHGLNRGFRECRTCHNLRRTAKA